MKIIILSIAIVAIAGFTMSTVMASSQDYNIPEWVRNNANWWAGDFIDDSTFANGLEFLIKEGIIVIPPTESTPAICYVDCDVIPSWIKITAGWWAWKNIDDNTFIEAIQWLIALSLIHI